MTIASLADLKSFADAIAAGQFTQEQIDCIVDATNAQPLQAELQVLIAELFADTPSYLPSDSDGMPYEQVESSLYELSSSQLQTYGSMDVATCAANPTCAFLMADDVAAFREAVVGEYNKMVDAHAALIKVHNESIDFYKWGRDILDGPTAGVEKKFLLRLLLIKEQQAKALKELKESIPLSEAKLNAANAKLSAARAKILEADTLTGESKKVALVIANALYNEGAVLVKDGKVITDNQKAIRVRFNTINVPIIP